ncbi:MAG: GerW family sporulation protein [Clostridia bacterium]|nr:GerW family sporulation protein [Clostridia bacterium]
MNSNVEGLMGVSVEKIREMVDANTVIGTPIAVGDGVTIIPVSKVSYGFASGGSDLPAKSSSDLFGGGAGAGINITPVAFLTIKDGEINLLPVVSKPDTLDRLVSLVPEAVSKISDMKKKKEDKTEE